MRNGQLKPVYNVQVDVKIYYVIYGYISADRTDYNPLIPVLEMHKENLGHYPKEVTADSGYCSEKNLLFLKDNDIESFIKLQEHEKMKTRAYQADISKYRNMTKITDGYLCAYGRVLSYDYTEYSQRKGFGQQKKVYSCEECSGCSLKAQCLYKYDETKHQDKNKIIKVNEQWDELKESSDQNTKSDKGILNRLTRSIQTEGFFGDMKVNDDFRQFNHRLTEKVFNEFLLYVFRKNIDKYIQFRNDKIKSFTGKTDLA